MEEYWPMRPCPWQGCKAMNGCKVQSYLYTLTSSVDWLCRIHLTADAKGKSDRQGLL